MSEKFSSVDMIVGKVPGHDQEKTELIKQKLMEGAVRTFRDQQIGPDPEFVKQLEVQASPEQVEIINAANDETNKLLQKYGLPILNIGSKNIHIISEENWDDDETAALFNPFSQCVFIKQSSSRLVFAQVLIHELLHFKSYGALQINKQGETDEYRSGLTVESRNGAKRYFEWLNEAIVEEIDISVLNQMKEMPLFDEENRHTQEMIKQFRPNYSHMLDDEIYYAKSEQIAGNKHQGEFKRYVYREERKLFQLLVDKIAQNNTEGLDSAAVKEMFTKAFFTGNILSIGKLIDRTFGQETFRQLGDPTNNIDQLTELINLL